MTIPIVFSTDHNYVMQTGVCLLSLLEHAGEAVYDIHLIINRDVTDDDKEMLFRQIEPFPGHTLTFTVAGGEFADSLQIRGISTATYYRLLIPWLFPQYDKIIFSDVDVIFHLSLSDIFTVELGDNYVAAIPAANFRRSKKMADYARKLGVVPDNYFNAGFLVIDARAQREAGLKDRYLELAQRRYTYQDQDIINIVCEGHILPVSPRYCITPAFYEMYLDRDPLLGELYGAQAEIDDYLRGHNCILHYAGLKPWNAFTFAYIDWWDTYRRSIFYAPTYEVNRQARIYRTEYSFVDLLKICKRYLVRISRRRY